MVERRQRLLTDHDIESISYSIHEKLKGDATGNFYIPPEEHYNAHKNLSDMYKDWKSIKNAFTKVFVGFLVVGVAAFAVAGLILEGGRHILGFLKGI